MKFEAPSTAGGKEEETRSEELLVAEKAYQEERALDARVKERSGKLARLTAAALVFYGVANEAEMLVKRDAVAEAYAAESMTLKESVSVGEVRLSSGEVISIPKPGENFERVTVYLPKDKAPDRLVLLFSQTHKLVAKQLQTYDSESRLDSLERAMESQRSIYTGLKNLIDQGSLTALCWEGAYDWDQVRDDMDWYGNYNSVATSSIVVNYLPGSDLARAAQRRDELFSDGIDWQDLDEMSLNIDPVFDHYAEQYKYLVGGGELLAFEGELTPCPGEGKEAYQNSDSVDHLFDKPRSTWTMEEVLLFKKLIYEDREDAALETILTNMPDSTIGLSFGSAHDFSNNVDKWNREHPDEQIGLVEMRTPYDL